MTSDNFIVHTDAGVEDVQPVLTRLQTIRQALSVTFFNGLEVGRTEVLIFLDERDYRTVAPKDSAGFFAPRAGSLERGLLVFPSRARNFKRVSEIAAHELAHQFMAHVSPSAPPWLNEGFATYVDALEVFDDLVVFDARQLSRGYAFFEKPVPLADLLWAKAFTRAHYMTAWMLVRLLLNSGRAGLPAGFVQFVKSVDSEPGDAALALRRAFAVSDLSEIDQQLRTWHRRVRWGVDQERTRSSVGVTVPPQGAMRLTHMPADREQVRRILQSLRRAEDASNE